MSRFGKNLPSQSRGQPIKAADLNAVRRTAEGLARQQIGGASMQTTIAGVPLSLAGANALVTLLLGKAPGTAIAGGSTGTVTLYEYGTVGTLSAKTLTARNPWPEACPASRKVALGTLNGVPDCILWWSCTDA